ncbi:MAG TPA: hypothetical protein VFU93_03740 [Acidimicrobiales bacterium]|nr:hypothetical protein [Acidimicrobiales bacterium]
MRRALAAAIALVLAAGVVATRLEGDDGALDLTGAERCGIELARRAGFDPAAASARIDQAAYVVSVSIREGALRLVVRRADGRVLEAGIIGPGGRQALERTARLAIYERGC